MINIKNKLKFIIILSILLFISILLFSLINNKAYANDDFTYEYVNDLSGDYVIESVEHTTENNRMGLNVGLRYGEDSASKTGGEAPKISIDEIDESVKAYQRFTFIPTEIKNGAQKYEITSCCDNNGRLGVLNNNFTNHNDIMFYDVVNSDETDNYLKSIEWFVLTKDGGKSFVIMNAVSDRMVIESHYDDGLDLCCIIGLNDTNSVLWNLVPVTGEIGINTKTYVVKDDKGYDITQGTEVSRFVEPYIESSEVKSVGSLSSVLSVGVHGTNIRKTTYEDIPAIAVNYDSDFYVDFSFAFNKGSEVWKEGKRFGYYKGVNATLSNDAYCFENKTTNKVGLGLYIFETSYDNINWEKEYLAFSSDLINNYWTISGEKISKGVYVRLSFVFELKYTKSYTDWTNNREITDTFFVCVDGFSQEDADKDTLSPILVHNLSTTDSYYNIEEGCDIEQIKEFDTLINNSVTVTGFSISSLFESYKIEISINNRDYIEVTDGYTQNNAGKYEIKVTTKFGTTKSITIYILNNNNNLESYFDTPFSNSLDDYSFIMGNRFLSGSNEYLNNNNIWLNYSYSQVPVYEKESKINIDRSTTLPILKGKVTRTDSTTTEEFEFEYNGNKYQKILTKPGNYIAELEIGTEIGDKIIYTIKWLIVDDAITPYLNEKLIKNNSQETYDLIPVYYGVLVTGDRYTFKDEKGNDVEKTQIIYYAFAEYNDALSFALRYEKEFSLKIGDNEYEYRGLQKTFDEYQLYREMLANAKNNVTKRYFSNTNSISMRIFTPYDENGEIRKYDDGITETIAYCLEMNTNYCIVTTDKIELAKLTSRQPFINNYKFISIPQDSSEVTLTDEKNRTYEIEYDVNVEEQLSSQEASTGKYIVTEENIYGDVNTYEVYYIAKNTKCDTELVIFESGRKVIYDYQRNNRTIEVYDSFKLISASNDYDNHSLIIISKDDEDIVITDTSKLTEEIEFNEAGIYNIYVEDRLGNYYNIKFDVRKVNS